MEKSKEGASSAEESKPRLKQSRPDENKEKDRAVQRQNKEEEKTRKAHNASLRQKINNLNEEKEKLQLESYAKARAMADPHIYRDEDTAREYGRRMKEIEKRLSGIEAEIKEIESRIV